MDAHLTQLEDIAYDEALSAEERHKARIKIAYHLNKYGEQEYASRKQKEWKEKNPARVIFHSQIKMFRKKGIEPSDELIPIIEEYSKTMAVIKEMKNGTNSSS